MNLEDDEECSSDAFKRVQVIDTNDEKQYTMQESSGKHGNAKPSQAYASIIENNKANYKLKMNKAKYVDDYNRLKVELLQAELKLRNQEYENIIMSAAMEQKINTTRLKILECELEIKQDMLKKQKETFT